MRFSKAKIEAIREDYVRGTDAGGKIAYLSLGELADKHQCGKRVISKYIARDGWPKHRQEYARAFEFEAHRTRILSVLSDIETSNSTDLSLAKLLSQEVLRIFAHARDTEHHGGERIILTANQLDLMAKVTERAQRIKRLAQNQSTAIVEQRTKAEAELAESQARSKPMGSDEIDVAAIQAELDVLATLEPAQLLRALTGSKKPESRS